MGLTRLCVVVAVLVGTQGLAIAQNDDRRERWRQARKDRARDRADANPGGGAVHGGKLVREGGFVFELVLDAESLRIYITDEKGEPVSARGFAGKVNIAMVRRQSMKGANHQSTSKKLGYLGKSKKKGRLRSCLATSHPLGKTDRQRVRIDVTLTKVPGRKGPLEFRAEASGSSKPVAYKCPNGCAKGGSFIDPGECPKCEKSLEREGAERDRDTDRDTDRDERIRRWRERQEQRRRDRERDGD